MKQGWLCPRCKQINSPYIGFCSCKSEDVYYKDTDSTTNQITDNVSLQYACHYGHEWVYDGAGEYHCAFCGITGVYVGGEIIPYTKTNIIKTNAQ